jgi:hypothetical protein
MSCRALRSLAHTAVLALCAGSVTMAMAQAVRSAGDYPDSKVDIYLGYGWYHPLNSGIDGKQFQDITTPNGTASVTYFFNHYVGVQAEGGYFAGSGEHRLYDPNCFSRGCDQLVYTAEGGPVLRYPMGRFVPFIHALGGGERTNGPVDQRLMWGWGVTGGIGLDYILPFFGNHLAIRPIQADWQYSQVVYGPLVLPAGVTGGFGEIDALKLSAGVVFRLGEKSEPPPLAFGCSAEPPQIYAGDPIVVTGSTMGADPKRRTSFSWATNGGQLSPHEATANVDTTGLPPGDYTVSGHVSQGPKAHQNASCEAVFHVNQVPPPTVSCMASPATAISGATIDISTIGTSPSNRTLTYSYSATAGAITGNGATAKLTTAGLGDQTITVTCDVSDDLSQRASATTQVTVSSPAVPVIPNTQSLCSISFLRDTRRPARVDNEAKACLDDVALTLSQQLDSKLVMIGNASPDEDPTLAAERAMNARQYLTQEKGVEPSRIELRVGETSGRSLDDVLVPSGATFNNPNTRDFDENAIKRHGEAYGVHNGSAAPIATGGNGMSAVSVPGGVTRHHKRSTTRRARSTATVPVTPVYPAQAPAAAGAPVTRIPPLQ